jgi:hypothetical protein
MGYPIGGQPTSGLDSAEEAGNAEVIAIEESQ